MWTIHSLNIGLWEQALIASRKPLKAIPQAIKDVFYPIDVASLSQHSHQKLSAFVLRYPHAH